MERRAHPGLTALCRTPTYVGLASPGLALLQHATKLYLVNVESLVHELAYQQTLRCFGRAPAAALEPPAPLRPLLLAALDGEEAAGRWDAAAGSKADIADTVASLLQEKAAMLEEYFALTFDFKGGGGEGRGGRRPTPWFSSLFSRHLSCLHFFLLLSDGVSDGRLLSFPMVTDRCVPCALRLGMGVGVFSPECVYICGKAFLRNLAQRSEMPSIGQARAGRPGGRRLEQEGEGEALAASAASQATRSERFC